jgi:hypothetical protein
LIFAAEKQKKEIDSSTARSSRTKEFRAQSEELSYEKKGRLENYQDRVLAQEFTQPNASQLNASWYRAIRSKFLESLDKMLSWVFDKKSRTYVALGGSLKQTLSNSSSEVTNFSSSCGYFSKEYPIVGRVTSAPADIARTCEFLITIHQEVQEKTMRQISTAEILTKVLAYRELKKGIEIPIPSLDEKGRPVLVIYEVNAVLDLWHGMPAFGLVPKVPSFAPPILLFRGTDLSLITERGWASVISDLEIKDPGLSAFLFAQTLIHEWLSEVCQKGKPAKVMGYSLGGVLATYTMIYENALILKDPKDPSFVFNTPGVSKKVVQDWEAIPAKQRPPVFSFVTEGDLVSKIGQLLSPALQFSTDSFLGPIAAHVTLMSNLPTYYLQEINVEEENRLHKL